MKGTAPSASFPEIDLYDYRNRTYSAELGRFLEPDPLGFAAGDDNMYRYCGNNPVNGIDPWGLTTADDVVFKKTEAGGTWDVPEYGTFENSAIEAAGGAYFTFEDGSTYSVGGTLDTMSVTAGIHSSQGLNDSGTGFEGGRTFSGGDGGRRGSAHSNSADNTFVWDKSDFTKLAKQMKDNQMPEFGAIVNKTVIIGLAVEVGGIGIVESPIPVMFSAKPAQQFVTLAIRNAVKDGTIRNIAYNQRANAAAAYLAAAIRHPTLFNITLQMDRIRYMLFGGSSPDR